MASGVHNVKTIKDLEKLEFKDQVEYINEIIKIEGNLVKASNRLGAKKTMIKNIFKKKNYNYNEETQQFESIENIATVEPQEQEKLSKKDLKKAKKESKKEKKQKSSNVSMDDVEIIQRVEEISCDVQEVQESIGDAERGIDDVQEVQKVQEVQEVQKSKKGGEGSTYTLESLQKLEAQEKMLDLINNYDSIKSMLEVFANKKGAISLTGGSGRTEGPTEIIEIVTGIQIDLPDSDNIKTSIRTNRVEWELFKTFMKENKEFSNADLIAQALKEFRVKHQKNQ